MGCDIHCIVEMKGKDGRWSAIKGSGWYRRDLKRSSTNGGEHEEYWKERYAQVKKESLDTQWIFEDRYYELFAILADVRNYEEYPALFAYRGLPHLSSIGTRLELRDWGTDAHSLTYFSLKDIKDADWDQIATKTAYVPDKAWEEFESNPDLKRPSTYAKEVWNAPDYNLHTWSYSYKDIAERFFKKVVSKMEILSRHTPTGDEGVRLVIFFDN